jgi:hypothetical protein
MFEGKSAMSCQATRSVMVFTDFSDKAELIFSDRDRRAASTGKEDSRI